MADIFPLLQSLIVAYPNNNEILDLYNHHKKLNEDIATK
jgi:hypothetical protein